MRRFFKLLIVSWCSMQLAPSLAHRVKSPDVISDKSAVVRARRQTPYSEDRNHGFKAAEKCREYAEAVAGGKISDDLSGHPMTGRQSFRPTGYPHMAALGWIDGEQVSWRCGGTLISEEWILTAAHCVDDNRISLPSVVLLGTNRLSDDTVGQLINIESVTVHPNYRFPVMYNDLALIKLERKVVFAANIKPACLHLGSDETPEKGWVTGWGGMGPHKLSSDILQQAEIEILDNGDCESTQRYSIEFPNGVIPSMVCAGDASGGWEKNVCEGDSGGPLQSLHTNGRLYRVIGITSVGGKCGIDHHPAIYTRVSHYVDFIESIVWPWNA